MFEIKLGFCSRTPPCCSCCCCAAATCHINVRTCTTLHLFIRCVAAVLIVVHRQRTICLNGFLLRRVQASWLHLFAFYRATARLQSTSTTQRRRCCCRQQTQPTETRHKSARSTENRRTDRIFFIFSDVQAASERLNNCRCRCPRLYSEAGRW